VWVRICQQCGAERNASDRFCATCGTALSTDPASGSEDPLVGRTVGGSYTLQEIIGVGGMGRVYRAEQAMLGRTVAVKVIHPHLLGDDQTVARFYNEAKAASRLNHPHSVSIIDFGRTDDGILYLVMEFITGKDLAMIMHEEGPLPFPRVCHVLTGVLDALGEAHALGVVHRDLKPENIIIRRFRSGQDLVKVVDFGLATIVGGPGDTSITRPGLVCGTPDYMSPEQGRGETVDGRGDLYSLGVVLFELLAEQLPFEGETPTKVVLRHLHDPVPDPRQVAPHRNVPDALAEVALRALSKAADDRYQTAAEMLQALRDAEEAMAASSRPRRDTATCPACGATNPAASRFCGTCGSRLTGRVEVPRSVRSLSRSSFTPDVGGRRPLVGREEDVARVDALRLEHARRPLWVQVHGEAGFGKTRLLEELAERYQGEGDRIEWASAHPTGALVPYHAIRVLLAALLNVEREALATLPPEALEDPLARAGLAEVLSPSGLEGLPGCPRTGAVAMALAAAVRSAFAGGGARVVLVVDDLHRCDTLTQRVLASLPAYLPDHPLLLLTAGALRADAGDDSTVLELQGIPWERAAAFLDARASDGAPGAHPSLPPSPRQPHASPLHLEQLQALHASGAGEEHTAGRLADVVLARVERLDVNARRVLQALAVLGDCVPTDLLRDVAEESDMGGLEVLQKHELVRLGDEGVEVVHPFIAELVEASIPAEARRALHGRALAAQASRGAPLEVRASHAFRAGEPMSALMLLERMGDTARERGDAPVAVWAFRRGLDLARRELLDSGDTTMDGAIVTFSRKLGEALDLAGDISGADGVLREALDLTGPVSPHRARMLIALGRVGHRRGRPRDAIRQLGQALELVEGRNRQLEGEVQLALAEVRLSEGDVAGATSAYERAVERLGDEAPVLQARARLAMGRALLQGGDPGGAALCLGEARLLAQESGAQALEAVIVGELGMIEAAAGREPASLALLEEAAELAARAGDADAHGRWRRATVRQA
jgi:serine/threonine protein kinase